MICFFLIETDEPKVKVTAGPTNIPVGGGVTLSCSVDDSDGWKYDWFRRTSNSKEAHVVGEENRDIRVSQGGIYRCRGRRGKPVYYTDYSDEVTVEITGEFSSCVSNISTHLSGHFTPIKLIHVRLNIHLQDGGSTGIRLFPNCQTDSTDMSCYLVVTVALKRILTWFMDRHTQQDMCVELEEENQCFTLNTANQRLSGLEVSLFWFMVAVKKKILSHYLL
uniref:Ig-like domain-containing protein n=1 Tax=Anabas testudineus TaxID=64144 RepID=A0A7N6BEX7_ANATE